jgi:hypothetical protein
MTLDDINVCQYLDDPGRFAPVQNIWVASAPPWARIDDALPSSPRAP